MFPAKALVLMHGENIQKDAFDDSPLQLVGRETQFNNATTQENVHRTIKKTPWRISFLPLFALFLDSLTEHFPLVSALGEPSTHFLPLQPFAST